MFSSLRTISANASIVDSNVASRMSFGWEQIITTAQRAFSGRRNEPVRIAQTVVDTNALTNVAFVSGSHKLNFSILRLVHTQPVDLDSKTSEESIKASRYQFWSTSDAADRRPKQPIALAATDRT
ncbi:MAG: hypothetical protein CM1200mP9_09460 [Gammaproteobacteria bacterium]|nr:MAG: hypothetical protein CM1200mP9_09460 [Gammaproteobacteria bacterium]